MTLPLPQEAQPYVDVSILEAGSLSLPEHSIIEGGSPTKLVRSPSLSFLLVHSRTNRKMIFDLGIRKDWEAYPPAVVQLIKSISQVHVPIGAVESLHRGGVEPDEVDTIVLSHVHFDHIGDPSLFPRAHFVVGYDSKAILASGYSPDDAEPANDSHFAKGLLPESRTSYLSTEGWKPLGPFPLTHDLFEDGSLYLVDAQGHLPGHLTVLARTSTNGAWLYLAGDSAHDVHIISGEQDIAMFSHPVTHKWICMHHNLNAAKTHIERIRQLQSINPRVLVLLAHDKGWLDENREKGVIFPGKIPIL